MRVESEEMMPILDLASVDGGMLHLAGGKAVNLGELIRAGLPVPAGVCVTTEAYRQVAAAAAIDFDAIAAAGPENVERIAHHAREALLSAPMPPALAQAIKEAYGRLGASTPVAVRSSATAEDLPNASFAGQQDTYLHIVGAGDVLDAVRRCWASLWTDRAVVYRNTNGIDHRAVRLAVVIQRMVDSSVAGVMFTANPVTGRRHQAVIDASPGLGEAVVSGAVNPDHFVVDTGAQTILERRLGDKRFEVRAVAGGGTQHIERPASTDQACVTDHQVLALAALGARVEAHYCAPQDTEWAIDAEGKLWLTQSRPITTLFPLPAGATAEELRVYFCFSVAQGLYRPITPMGLAAFRIMASAAAKLVNIPVTDPLTGPPAYAEAAQRVFIDLTNVMRGRVGRALMPRMLDVMEARSAAILRNITDDPRLSLTRRTPFLFLRRLFGIATTYGVPLQVMQALARPEASLARIRRIGETLAAKLTPAGNVDTRRRLDFVEQMLLKEVISIGPRTMPAAAVGLAMWALAGKVLGDDAEPDEMQTVLRSLPNNITTEMDLALWETASVIRNDGCAAQAFRESSPAELARQYHSGLLPRTAQDAIGEFLQAYGHRAVAEIDLGVPRWSDDAAHIVGVIANYLRLDNDAFGATTQFSHGAAAAEEMIRTLTNRARTRGRIRAAVVRFALHRTRQLAGLREIMKYYMVSVLAAVRRELSKVGAELAATGRIQLPDDIYFLDFRETRAALDGNDMQAVVCERRQSYEAELRRRHTPRVMLSDGTEPEAREAVQKGSAELTGTAASAGTVTGVARVIDDPVGAHLEPGEILVAPSTDPGWTPLFLTAGGLVMEMGGANSHGAVVAREYGIPAVVGVAGALLSIRTGQRITVDGSRGAITVLI